MLVDSVTNNMPITLFKFFEFYPMSGLLSVLGLLLIVTFFVSSSNSGSLVIDTLASGGMAEPPVWQRVYWAVLEGVVVSALLIAGGIAALQTMAIATAFPMIILLLVSIYSFVIALKNDHLLIDSVQNYITTHTTQQSSDWESRLKVLTSYPTQGEIEFFLTDVIKPAMEELSTALKRKDLDVNVNSEDLKSASLHINNADVEDFKY